MDRPSGLALLLSQVGAQVSDRFARRLMAHDLAPAHVGVLRVVGRSPGLSQQELARRVGARPSRIVKLVDDLEARGLLERRRSRADRRQQELYVAGDAGDRIAAVMASLVEHDREVGAALSAAEREQLVDLLRKVARSLDVGEGHPGYERD